MTAADRILTRKAETAACIDLLRAAACYTTAARMLEARLAALSDALQDAREAELSARLATTTAMVAAPLPPLPDPPMIAISRDANGHLVATDMRAETPADAPTPDSTPHAAEASAPEAAPPADAGDQVLKIWSPERVALLRDLYTQPDLTLDEVRDRLNELPGPPVNSANAVKVRGWKLGLLRPALPATPLASSAPGEGTASPQPTRRAGKTPHVWTPERTALLQRQYAAGVKRGVILDQVNALPGPPCASTDALKMHAKKLGLTRQGADTPATFAAALPEAAPPAAIPPAVAPPAAAQPARDEADPLTWHPAEDIAEARQMMRAGKCGARALAEYFGWQLAEAQAIAAALRDDLEAEARSRAA